MVILLATRMFTCARTNEAGGLTYGHASRIEGRLTPGKRQELHVMSLPVVWHEEYACRRWRR